MATANPKQTRERLLLSAFHEIHSHGYQGMRVDEVLRQSDLQKDAIHHDFKSKTEPVFTELEKLIAPLIESIWISQLADMEDPIRDLPCLRT